METQHQRPQRGGSSSPIVIMLLAGILIALVGLIVVLVIQGGGKSERDAPDGLTETSNVSTKPSAGGYNSSVKVHLSYASLQLSDQ